jgi:dUTP pyrophosphatase
MQIRVVNTSSNPLPAYETAGAAGMDICASLTEPVVLAPTERRLIPTGLYLEIPLGYEAQIRPRSGIAYKHGITLPNAPATIDSDYRGEIQVALVNLSTEAFTIRHGDRIAQIIIAQHERAVWQPTDALTDTARGAGGFGHTGT